MHIKYYIEPMLLNTEINTTAFWNIRFSIDADTAVVSQAAPLSPPVENRYPILYVCYYTMTALECEKFEIRYRQGFTVSYHAITIL